VSTIIEAPEEIVEIVVEEEAKEDKAFTFGIDKVGEVRRLDAEAIT
jgi:hypothetical protein